MVRLIQAGPDLACDQSGVGRTPQQENDDEVGFPTGVQPNL
jgi:hypothetical protein